MALESKRSDSQDAAKLLERLGEVYLDYKQKDSEKSKRGVVQLFRKWFVSFDPQAVQPIHQAFLDEVEHVVTELASALEQIKEEAPDACADYAEQALDCMLASKPGREKTTFEWYLTIAEYQCVSLLPYASADKLQCIHQALLARTPKRLMYPKQRELLETIEKIIKQKRHNFE